MKKGFCYFLILLVLLAVSVQAESALWTCPECGQTGNEGSTCVNCGANAPEAETTETTQAERVFELSPDILSDRGRFTVSWTDSEDKSPYKVLAQCQGSPDVLQPQYIESEGTSAFSFTMENLLPGRTYTIEIQDCEGISASRTYTLPDAGTFVDGLLKANGIRVGVEFRRKESGERTEEARRVVSLKASDMAASRDIYDYGFRYQIRTPSLAQSRAYFTQVALIAPNGYTDCEIFMDLDYSRESSGRFWYMLGDWTFDMMLAKNGSIASGKWTVELYWDGMLVNQSFFTIR